MTGVMDVRSLVAAYRLGDVRDAVARHAVALSKDETATDVARSLFGLHYALAILLTHTGSVTDPEVSYWTVKMLSVLTAIDNVRMTANECGLSESAVKELEQFSLDTSVLFAAFSTVRVEDGDVNGG